VEFQINFNQIDSWFFKESRPMNSLGNNEMQSLFPPTAYTMSGVVRSLLGEHAQLNWSAYRKGDGTQHNLDSNIDFCQEIGNPKQPNDLGNFQLQGFFPSYQEKPLLPAPLNLVHKKIDTQDTYHRMQISKESYQTDLGKIRLAELPDELKGAKPLEETWVSLSLFEQLLQGKLPQKNTSEVHPKEQVLTTDPRLGIAINTKQRTTLKGQLYQTAHIRLAKGYALSLFAHFNEALNPQQGFIRFGAEGRQAHASVQAHSLKITPPTLKGDEKGLILYFLTHANFESHFIPEGFKKTEKNGQTLYQGEVHGIPLTIESMILGKAIREGGWDLAHHKPKPAPQLIPAGSCWYITTPDLEKAIYTLHLSHLGQETQFGRGLIACGLWK